jgi:colanic acid/amylovoran biosynthesis glycosyltransferase
MYRVLVYRRKYLKESETFIYEQLIGHRRVKPIVLTRHKLFNVNQFPYRPVYVRKRLDGLSNWLIRQKIKLLHARFGPAGLELLPFARKNRLPLLTSFHGFDATKRVKQKRSYREALKGLFRKGNAFTVVSNHMKKQLVRLGCPPEKITLIRSGIDLKKFPMLPPQPIVNEAFHILSVGRLTEKKGMDTLIEAFAGVLFTYPNATLTIVGDGEEKQALLQLIKRYDLGQQVTLRGSLPHQEVQGEMARCHLFVIACQTARDGNQEGIPNVLMEAMASGRPVISTYHAGVPELVEHGVNGFLVPERSPGKLAAMMVEVMDQCSTWSEIVARARQKVEKNHDIHKQRVKLEKLYLRLIKQNEVKR